MHRGNSQLNNHKNVSEDSESIANSEKVLSEIRRNQQSEFVGQTAYVESPRANQTIILNDCNDVKFGGSPINKYEKNPVPKDYENPAAILKDEEISCLNKVFYVLGARWCLALLLLSFTVAVCVIGIVLILKPKQEFIFIYHGVAGRDVWGADDAIEGIPKLDHPISRIIVTHTADEDGSCQSQSECIRRVKQIQEDYMKTLKDIPFNFLVGDDGYVYEGRGFEFQGELVSNRSVSSFDDIGIIVAFIGTFGTVRPGENQNRTFFAFLDEAVTNGNIQKDFVLLSQDQLLRGEIPAPELLESMRYWDKFYSLQQQYSRQDWGALDVDASLFEPTEHPIHHYSILFPWDFSFTDLASFNQHLREFQANEISQGFDDISYNFVISEFGIFEGRGWDRLPHGDYGFDPDVTNFIRFLSYTASGDFSKLDLLLADGEVLGKVLLKVP